MNLWRRAGAYRRLGLRSILDVMIYRLGLKSGLHPALQIRPVETAKGDFFAAPDFLPCDHPATLVWQGRPWAFGYPVSEACDDPPDWHANILTEERVENPRAHWNDIPAFSESVGDIKTVWEASRFDWVLAFAQNAARGDRAALAKLNHWLTDWAYQNPPFCGPNWMCGQEASLRVAHLALAARFLGQEKHASPALKATLINHLRRIAPTIAYARGQDNNHAISEGMGLFIGGLWLNAVGETEMQRAEGSAFSEMGRALLEERVKKLIFADGGFSQYSMTYHRLMLDSLSLSEYFRATYDAAPFSGHFYEKAASAAKWLTHFTDNLSGDVPNLGSNDGAWLLPVGSGEYRDFRPSCALAMRLFCEESRFVEQDSVQSLLNWFTLDCPDAEPAPPDKPVRYFPDSGIISFQSGSMRVFLRLPGYKYRPLQADALHLDCWLAGDNVLQDAGTFSYAADGWDYFPSTAAHNTIEFDGRDQMPRLSRFLYGSWLKRRSLNIGQGRATASYRDYRGNRHRRNISLESPQDLRVTDEIEGGFEYAILRWRLRDIPYKLENNILSQDGLQINIESTQAMNIRVVKSPASIHYLAKHDILVLEIELSQPGTIFSNVRFAKPYS